MPKRTNSNSNTKGSKLCNKVAQILTTTMIITMKMMMKKIIVIRCKREDKDSLREVYLLQEEMLTYLNALVKEILLKEHLEIIDSSALKKKR